MFKRILIPVTAESLSYDVFQYALEFATAIKAAVVLTYVMSATDSDSEAESLLESYAQRAANCAVPCQKHLTERLHGTLGNSIFQAAIQADCDLILIGTHALDRLSQLLFGSITESLVHSTHLPVLVLHQNMLHYTPIKTVLVPVDGQLPSNRAVALAASLAPELAAELVFVHVVPDMSPPPTDVTGLSGLLYDPSGEISKLEAQSVTILQHAQSEAGGLGTVQRLAANFESVALRILESATSQKADLIVMGTHGRVGLQRLLFGSVTQAVMHRATTPILVLHSDK